MKKALKYVLSLAMAVIVVAGVMAPAMPSLVPTASAADFSNFYTKSDMWLVDSNTHKTASTLYLYGRADYICLKIKQTGKYSDVFYFKLYSDSKRTKEVLSYSTEYSKVGTKYITLPVSFDKLKNGTYYAETYVYKMCSNRPMNVWLPDSYVHRELDKGTKRTYKVKINKKGTDIDEMNTVMYGFENTEKGPRIYWYSVPGATGYYVYRKDPETGKYSKIKKVKDSGNKFTTYVDGTYKDKNATRYYKVVAYKGSLKTPSSLKAMKVKILKTPTITITPKADNNIKVSWSKVASGAEYTLFVRSGNSDWSEVKTTESRSATVSMKNRTNNTSYYFTVIANVNGLLSGYNVKGKAYKNIKAPELAKCTYSENGNVIINWKAVTGSDQYTIYKKVENEWKKIAIVDGGKTSYTDTQSDCYTYNSYTVSSMSNGSLKSYSSKGVNSIKLEEVLFNDIVEENGKLKVSWVNPIENQVCNYKVYVKKGDNWEYYETVSGKGFYYNINENNLEYAFNVCATYQGFNGPRSKTGVSYTYYPIMSKPTVIADSNGALISWSAMGSVDGYVLYKANAEGEFEVIAQTTETSFVDTEIENNVNYSYKLAYVYKGEIVSQKESEKTTVSFVDEEITIKAGSYMPYSNHYTVEFENYIPDGSHYQLYRKDNNGWVREYNSYLYPNSCKMSVPCRTGVTEYALLKIYADGRVSRLPDNGFIVDCDGAAKDVKFSSDKNTVTFSWNPDTFDADKVIIYRNNELVGEANRIDGKFVEENVKSNKDHYYTIYTQKNNFIAKTSVCKNFTCLVEPEFTVSAVKGGVYITWTGIEADCYVDIYRAKGSTGEFKKIDTARYNWESIKDDTVKSGTTYRYALILRNDSGYKSAYNPNGKKITYYNAPVITSDECTKKGVKLEWSEVTQAEKYVLSYKKGGKWQVITELPAGTTSYVDKKIQSGEKRNYKIYACIGDVKSAEETKQVCYLDRPTIKNISSTTKQIKISYNAVKGATDYKIYYKTGDSKKWKTLATTSKTSYTHKIKDPNVKYTYAVSAVWVKSGKDCISYKSSSKTAKNLATPVLNTIASTKSGIKLTWGVTSYATGYNVYRKNSDGEFEKLAYVKGRSNVSYVDKSAKKGKTYTYTVRATYGNCVSGCNKTGLKCKDKY